MCFWVSVLVIVANASNVPSVAAVAVAAVAVQDAATVGQLQELQSVLTLEYERSQATPAMRLLDEVWM